MGANVLAPRLLGGEALGRHLEAIVEAILEAILEASSGGRSAAGPPTPINLMSNPTSKTVDAPAAKACSKRRRCRPLSTLASTC